MQYVLKIAAGLLLIACTSALSFAAEEGGAATDTTAAEKTETFTLDVTGMTCQGCVAKVDKGLKACEGVAKAEVSLDKNCAVVVAKAGTDISTIIKAVEATGFKAKKQEAAKEEVKEESKEEM